MTCDICGGNTRVITTVPDCEAVYRRRECLECGHFLYSVERQTYDDEDKKALWSIRKKRSLGGME